MALNIPEASEQALAGSAPGPGAEVSPAAKKIEGRSPWRLATQRLLHDKASMISLGVIGLIVLVLASRLPRALSPATLPDEKPSDHRS